jgi:hypothetical protein
MLTPVIKITQLGCKVTKNEVFQEKKWQVIWLLKGFAPLNLLGSKD